MYRFPPQAHARCTQLGQPDTARQTVLMTHAGAKEERPT
jgi:hypothetical protein